jgi:hypothetical protein
MNGFPSNDGGHTLLKIYAVDGKLKLMPINGLEIYPQRKLEWLVAVLSDWHIAILTVADNAIDWRSVLDRPSPVTNLYGVSVHFQETIARRENNVIAIPIFVAQFP